MCQVFLIAGCTEEAWLSQQKCWPGLVSCHHVYSDGCHCGLGVNSFQTIVTLSFIEQPCVIGSLVRL